MLPSKDVWNQTIDAAEQRERSLQIKAQSYLRHKARNRPTAGKGNHYFPSETEIYFSFRKLFSPHYDGEKVKLKATEKQIIALQQVPTQFHPIQGCGWPYPKLSSTATSQTCQAKAQTLVKRYNKAKALALSNMHNASHKLNTLSSEKDCEFFLWMLEK